MPVEDLSRIFPDGLGNISSREKTSNNSKKRNFSIITSIPLCDFVLTPSDPAFLFAYARGEFSKPIDGTQSSRTRKSQNGFFGCCVGDLPGYDFDTGSKFRFPVPWCR